MTLLVPTIPACIKINKNEFSTDDSSGIGSSRIDDKIANLLSFTKKISFKVGFLTLKASLAFIWWRKIFTEAPILHYFDLECHIQIKTDVSSYVIDGILSQLTTKRGLASQVTHKTNNQPINLPSEIGPWHSIAFFS